MRIYSSISYINMNRYILTNILLTVISFFSFSQTKHKENAKVDIPFQEINGYFVKNTFTKDILSKAKITTQKEFDSIFGAAAYMGKDGTPTSINFKRQYVIAVIDKESDFNAKLSPISLKKRVDKIQFEYKISLGSKQTFTVRPFTMILVDKKYTGKVETKNLQTTAENSGNIPPKMLNNQWIIAFFNNPERVVETKNCYVNIDLETNKFKGNDGCNLVNGSVKINGDYISFGNIMRTKRACENMTQGDIFMKNLSNVNKYKIVGGELFLYKEGLLIMTLESFK